jgi:predicted anti-sigma-YlaC factor YlaD
LQCQADEKLSTSAGFLWPPQSLAEDIKIATAAAWGPAKRHGLLVFLLTQLLVFGKGYAAVGSVFGSAEPLGTGKAIAMFLDIYNNRC